MEDLLICDLDGVIADSSERDDAAYLNFFMTIREYKSYPAASRPTIKQITQEATDLYWRSFFDPVGVPYDTPIEGAREALSALTFVGWNTTLLSARPEKLREATVAWLIDHKFNAIHPTYMPDRLRLKPPDKSFEKTIDWKVSEIKEQVQLYQPARLLVIDDRQDILDAVSNLKLPCKVYTALSLERAKNRFA